MITLMQLDVLMRRHSAPLILVLAAAMSSAAHAEIAAMVLDLQGKANLGTGSQRSDVSILTGVEAGSAMQLQSGATLVVLYLTGGAEYLFKGPALIVFQPAGPEVTSGAPPIKRVPAIGTGVRIKPRGMGQGALVMRHLAGPPSIQLLTANGTKVLGSQPELRWRAPQPGLTYKLRITDERGRSLHEAQVDEAVFRVPAAAQLREGIAYLWEVTTRLPDGRGVSGIGRFDVAPSALRNEAAAKREKAADPVSSRVMFALWLAQVELNDEARSAWRALAIERPDDAGLKLMAEN